MYAYVCIDVHIGESGVMAVSLLYPLSLHQHESVDGENPAPLSTSATVPRHRTLCPFVHLNFNSGVKGTIVPGAGFPCVTTHTLECAFTNQH